MYRPRSTASYGGLSKRSPALGTQTFPRSRAPSRRPSRPSTPRSRPRRRPLRQRSLRRRACVRWISRWKARRSLSSWPSRSSRTRGQRPPPDPTFRLPGPRSSWLPTSERRSRRVSSRGCRRRCGSECWRTASSRFCSATRVCAGSRRPRTSRLQQPWRSQWAPSSFTQSSRPAVRRRSPTRDGRPWWGEPTPARRTQVNAAVFGLPHAAHRLLEGSV